MDIPEDVWLFLGCWRRLLSPLDWKEIKPVNPKGNQSWMFIGRTDAEAETSILWLPDVKNWLLGKRLWCWARLKAGGEKDDIGWDGWMASPTRWAWVWASSGVGDGQGSLACCSPWGHRVRHDWATELNLKMSFGHSHCLQIPYTKRDMIVDSWISFLDGIHLLSSGLDSHHSIRACVSQNTRYSPRDCGLLDIA